MSAGDLLGQSKANAAARGLRCIEGNEEVLRIRNPQSAILNHYLNIRVC